LVGLPLDWLGRAARLDRFRRAVSDLPDCIRQARGESHSDAMIGANWQPPKPVIKNRRGVSCLKRAMK